MRIKDGFIINKLGDGFVVVAVGEAGESFKGVIKMNSTGAFLWESIASGVDNNEELVKLMLEHYEDLDASTAKKDLTDFLDSIAIALEV